MIQSGFNNFSGFCNRVGYNSRYSTFNFYFAYICTIEEPRTGNKMDLTPEVEYGFIRDAVSHILERYIVNPSNKVWRDSTKIKFQLQPYKLVTL